MNIFATFQIQHVSLYSVKNMISNPILMFALKKVVTVKILYSLIARKTVRYYSIEGFWRCPIFQTSILYIGCNNCRPKILCCTLYTSPQSCHKPILIKSVKISVTYWRLVTGTVFTPGFSHPLSSHGSFFAHPLSSHGSFFAHPLSSHGSFFAHSHCIPHPHTTMHD